MDRYVLSHDQRRLAWHWCHVDQARVELGRRSIGAASWVHPFGEIFGDLKAVLRRVPRHVARVLKFPERRNEIAKLRSEIEEIKRLSVR